jgi:hypothetical protein
MRRMQDDEVHLSRLDAIDHLPGRRLLDLLLALVSPPDQDVALLEDGLAQAVLLVVHRDRLGLDPRLLPQDLREVIPEKIRVHLLLLGLLLVPHDDTNGFRAAVLGLRCLHDSQREAGRDHQEEGTTPLIALPEEH